ncbi:MAG TPA: hypothetical protein VIA10_18715 [Gaiellaceae bacterium]|jgi:hypothetical protein
MEACTASISRALAVAAIALAALGAAAEPSAAPVGDCAGRPVVDAFVAALDAGDLDRLDDVFAAEGDGWVWYFVNDPAGQRLGRAAAQRDTLRGYFGRRIAQRETLRILRFAEHANGNFTFVLRRRADDLRGGRPVERAGKGWVSCETGKLGVWGLGGAPAPATFGPCVRGALPLRGDRDVREATAAVRRFLRDVYAEHAPALDVAHARVLRAAPAVGNALGFNARVRCGRAVQKRTVVVEVDFPGARPAAFYVSRTRAGWLVWRRVS